MGEESVSAGGEELPGQVLVGEALLGEADARDLRERLKKAERRKSRHGLWLMLGMSPSALIPFIGLTMEGSKELAVVLAALVVVVEAVQWLRAQREVTDLRTALAVAEERAAALPAEGP